ncbi:ribonuclease CAF1 [Gamsiella multidivaricata]|uniref:ribonuclease CAF1 n=1 Tax=Gamsiella multidivaricata TaxID=101098 RepID=UPI00221E7C69|nr:ribonuclease CAF1 [Gamsiella multidivaricata]KAI7823376.1 ribonuclease CAF1 [Gamsiella multidivaricata]
MHVAQIPLPTYNQVTKHNLALMQPMIIQLIKQATFIALDAEFTGLGPKVAATRTADIQERYQHMCALAKSHALVAFGLSIFIKTEPASESKSMDGTAATGGEVNDRERGYKVHNFNFSMLSETDYAVSPRSMIFLAENGLDLNQWIMEGIPYTGGDRLVNEGGRGNPNGIMRSIFKRIMSRQVPVAVHNGFLDLVFLYHSFYASLPPKLSTFVADLSDMFPGGLFDTKYVSDYMTRERSSFLAYLFRKYERDDSRAREETDPSSTQVYSTFHIQPRLGLPAIQQKPISETSSSDPQLAYCEDYAFHGVCKKNMWCGKSHDLDLILDAEEQRRDSKRRKTQKRSQDAQDAEKVAEPGNAQNNVSDNVSETKMPTPSLSTEETTELSMQSSVGTTKATARAAKAPENVVQPGEKFHSAYFDAFMTGTIFSHQLNQHTPEEVESQAKNKVYLIGKSIPLIIEKSAFAKFSLEHERSRAL